MKLINPGGIDTSIYGNDGVISGNRIVDVSGNTLSFTNSDIDIDANLAVPSISDADEDTIIYLEETADEDRIRIEVPSALYASGDYSVGHIDTDGLEFRSFANADAQVLLADDEVNTGSSLTRRAELLVKRDTYPDSVPLSSVIPGIVAGDSGSFVIMQAGRDTRVAGLGVMQDDIASGSNVAGIGMWGKNFSREQFMGFQPGSSMWIRDDDGVNETYIRLDSTRLQIRTNLTGSGGTSQVMGRDDTHYNSGGGAHWKNSITASRLRSDVGDSALSAYDLQVFDGTLRGMSWVPTTGTLGQSATGSNGSPYGVQMNVSANPVPTPAAANLVPGIPLCTAFDAFGNGGPSGQSSASFFEEIVCEITFELNVAPTGESIYELYWWENSHDARLNDSIRRLSFNTGRTVQHVHMTDLWPGKFLGIGIGPLGYSQVELRIQRVSGADDIRVLRAGAHIMINRRQ